MPYLRRNIGALLEKETKGAAMSNQSFEEEAIDLIIEAVAKGREHVAAILQQYGQSMMVQCMECAAVLADSGAKDLHSKDKVILEMFAQTIRNTNVSYMKKAGMPLDMFERIARAKRGTEH